VDVVARATAATPRCTIRKVRVVDEVPTEAPAGADEGAAPRQRRLTPPRFAALGIVAALALGIVAVVRSGNQPSTLTPAQIASSVSSQVDKGIAAAANVPPQGEIAFHAIQPSVVYINSKRAGAAPDDSMSGAGVVVDATGRILTARHVVHGADSIEVTFADGTETSATIASSVAAFPSPIIVRPARQTLFSANVALGESPA